MTKKSIFTFKSVKNILVTLLVWAVIIEVLLRLILPVPFFDTTQVIRCLYPEYKTVKKRIIPKDDDNFDVLILGGSVVASYYPIEGLLKERLQKETTRPIKIHNVAEPAHTSLDSYIKYKSLTEKSFDLVLFYHAINETRVNNCPEEIFKEDYSHYSWYRALHQIDRHKELKWTILPYTIHYISIYIKEWIGSPDLIHFKSIREEWMDYGANVKTKVSFQNNIEGILDIAKAKQEKVVLMGFSYYIADGYTKEKFINKELDYTVHNRAIEIWGKPDLVEKGILAHNEVSKSMAQQNEGVYFMDQNAVINKNGTNFLDICHFTEAGSGEWVDHLVAFLKEEALIE